MTAPCWRCAPGPSSESLQGRNPREIGRGLRCRAMGISPERAEGSQVAAARPRFGRLGFRLERWLRALLLLAGLERAGVDNIWCVRDALVLVRPMDRLV
jgi:hypothetical protein